MFRFNLACCVAASAIVFAVVLPAQATVVFTEDFEAPGPDLETLGYTAPQTGFTAGIPVVDPGANLGTRVAGISGGNSHWVKSFGGSGLEDLTEFDFDAYVTGMNPGEGFVGVRAPFGAGVGECTGINNCGVFVGIAQSTWTVDLRGLDGGKVNITDGGGADFVGAINVPLSVEVDIDKTAGEVRIDILNRTSGASLNPTFTVGLSAAGVAAIDDLQEVVVQWGDDFNAASQLIEVDNISVNSVPEPRSILLFAIALTTFALRRRGLS